MKLPEWIVKEENYLPATDREYFLAKSLLKITSVLRRYQPSLQPKPHSSLKPSPMGAMASWLVILLICALSHHSILLHSICCILLCLLCLYQGKTIWQILRPALLMGIFTMVLMLLPYKSFISLVVTGIFIHSYSFQQISCTLSWLHLPHMFIFILDTTLRYIYLLGGIAQDSLTALSLRSIGRNPHKTSSTLNILGTVYLKSQQMSLEMYQAMICRGFSGQYPHRHQQPFWLADICPAIICILLIVLYIYLEY